MADQPQGCARTTGSVVGEKPLSSPAPEMNELKKEMTMTAKVGQKAPDFEAPAYYQGKFTIGKAFRLSGKWVLVCFYPGDFTFV